MSFASGTVSFKRFFVGGAIVKHVTEHMIEALAERAIGKGISDVENGTTAGWITGDHILDTRFDFAKNAIGDCLFAAMRVDANKPPSDLVRSYQKMHEQALLEKSGRDFLSKQERREAREAARDQAEREARDGRFNRMHQYQMLWDLERKQVFLAATSPGVVDRFGLLFKETFDRPLTAACAGELASRYAGKASLVGALEDIRPAQFVRPPEGLEPKTEDAPTDEARNRDYLGREWLTWLWYLARREEIEETPASDGGEAVIRFEKTMQMDCAYNVTGSVAVKSDDPSHMAESAAALASGKIPLRAGLQIVYGNEAYACGLRADVMHFSSVMLPPPPPDAESPRVIFEERIAHLRLFNDAVEASFEDFMKHRLSSRWPKLLSAIRAWIVNAETGASEGRGGVSGVA